MKYDTSASCVHSYGRVFFFNSSASFLTGVYERGGVVSSAREAAEVREVGGGIKRYRRENRWGWRNGRVHTRDRVYTFQ